jgi:hypothetical protein
MMVMVMVPVAAPVSTMAIPVAAMPIPVAAMAIPVAATPIAAAAPALTAPRTHSRTTAHSGAPTHEMMTTTAAAAPATVRRSRENRRGQHRCNNTNQGKQKFRIIHNQSGFLSTSLDTARDSKSRFIFTVAEN